MLGDRKAQPARLLVVDDEEVVRQAVRRTLEADGYEVVEAANGADALMVVQQDARFDLVVADLDMPRLSGADMVCRMRGADPTLKVLYVTGFIDSLMDTRALWEDEAFLEKPFTVTGLREAVSLLLYGSLIPARPATGLRALLERPRMHRLVGLFSRRPTQSSCSETGLPERHGV